MNKEFILSIIIPYHNNEYGIETLLSSIPKKIPVEVVIVNDNSEDIYHILDNFHSLNIKYVRLDQEKRWAGAARNKGMEMASGDYYLFADSDDYFLDGFYSFVEECFHENFDVVYFSPKSIMSTGASSKRHVLYEMLINDYFKGSNEIKYKFHVPWSKLFRSDFLRRNNIFFDEVVASNDVNFSLKSSLLAKSISVKKDSIYCVVEDKNSLTKNMSEAVLDSRFDALSRYNDFLLLRKDNNLAAMSGHLKNSFKFGFSKFLSRLFYCKHKGYPIFYGFSHFIKALRYLRMSRK